MSNQQSPKRWAELVPIAPPCQSAMFAGKLFYGMDPEQKDIMDHVEASFCSGLLDNLHTATTKQETAAIMSRCNILDPFYCGRGANFTVLLFQSMSLHTLSLVASLCLHQSTSQSGLVISSAMSKTFTQIINRACGKSFYVCAQPP
jgi:hypothetical protein